jgi:hypothetical protein
VSEWHNPARHSGLKVDVTPKNLPDQKRYMADEGEPVMPLIVPLIKDEKKKEEKDADSDI